MENMPAKGSIEAKDPFAFSPPGHSLTEDISKWAWGKPPQDVDPELVLAKAINSLKQPMIREEMIKLLIVGASVEALVEGYIFQAFQEGQFMPDVGLLIKGPLAIYIANMAEENDIPYRFFENDDALQEGEMDDKTFFTMMSENNPAMFNYVSTMLNKGIRDGKMPRPPEEENFITMKDRAEK